MSIILLSFIKGIGPFLKTLCACTVVKTPWIIFNLLFKGKESCPRLSGPGMAALKRQWHRFCCLPHFLNCKQWYWLLLKRKEWVCMNWSPWSLHWCHLAEMALSASSHPDLMVKSLSLCCVQVSSVAKTMLQDGLESCSGTSLGMTSTIIFPSPPRSLICSTYKLSGMLIWCLKYALFFKKLKIWLMMNLCDCRKSQLFQNNLKEVRMKTQFIVMTAGYTNSALVTVNQAGLRQISFEYYQSILQLSFFQF